MRKHLFCAAMAALLAVGCETPEVRLPRQVRQFHRPKVEARLALKNVDEMVSLAPLPEGKDVAVQNFGGNEYVSIRVVQARKMGAHYHSFHDETVYMRSGQGTLCIDDRDYQIKAGALMLIPKGAIHSFVSSSREPAVVVSITSPPSDGRDHIQVKEPE